MASRIPESKKQELREYLKLHEPYSQEEIDAMPWDRPSDLERMAATFAKMALEADEENERENS